MGMTDTTKYNLDALKYGVADLEQLDADINEVETARRLVSGAFDYAEMAKCLGYDARHFHDMHREMEQALKALKAKREQLLNENDITFNPQDNRRYGPHEESSETITEMPKDAFDGSIAASSLDELQRLGQEFDAESQKADETPECEGSCGVEGESQEPIYQSINLKPLTDEQKKYLRETLGRMRDQRKIFDAEGEIGKLREEMLNEVAALRGEMKVKFAVLGNRVDDDHHAIRNLSEKLDAHVKGPFIVPIGNFHETAGDPDEGRPVTMSENLRKTYKFSWGGRK